VGILVRSVRPPPEPLIDSNPVDHEHMFVLRTQIVIKASDEAVWIVEDVG